MQASMVYYMQGYAIKVSYIDTPFTVKKSSNLFPHSLLWFVQVGHLEYTVLVTGSSLRFLKILKFMAVFVVNLVILFAMATHSDASYCVCNGGLNDSALQKNIDYSCGSGADCSGILQNGACFNPNTVKDHCNYAVNSYYQRKGQTPGSCDFVGTATVTPNAPNAGAGCVYPSSPSNGSSSVGGTPTNMNSTNPGVFVPPGGSGFDSSASMTLLSRSTMTSMLLPLPFFFLTLFLYGLM